MISSMRNRFKSKKYQPIIWIALLSLLGAASLPELIKRFLGSGDWIIQIEGNSRFSFLDRSSVSPAQFERKVEEEKQYLEYFKTKFGAYASAILASSGLNLDPRELAIKALTQELLLNRLMDQLDVQIDSEFLQNEILKKLPKEVIAQYGTDMQLLSQLLNYPSVAEFEKSMESNLKNSVALELSNAALYIPEFELKNNFNAAFAKKKFSILVFPFEKYLNEVKKNSLSKEEIKKYFDEQNKKEKKYWIPEKREGVKYEFSSVAYGIKTTDKEIETYYNRNKTTEFIEHPAQIEVKRILFNIKKDKSDFPQVMQKAQKIKSELMQDKSKFADYAKKYSEDKETAQKGGLVEFFSKGQKDPVFEKAAFELKNDGDVSDPFETKYGIEIIQRASKKPVTFKKLENVKNTIKSNLESEKFKKLFTLDMKRFASESNEKSFKEFVLKKGPKEIKIGLTENNNSLPVQKLFGIKKENGIASYLDDSKGVAIQLTKLEKSYVPALDSVQKTVEEDLYKQKALDKMSKDIKATKEKVSTEGLEKIKYAFGANLKTTSWIGFEDKSELEKLQKEGIPTDKLFDLEKEDTVSEIIPNNSGTPKAGYLIRLEHIEPFNIEKFEARKSQLEQELTRKRKQELEIGFIASLKKNAKININEKALKQFRSIR